MTAACFKCLMPAGVVQPSKPPSIFCGDLDGTSRRCQFPSRVPKCAFGLGCPISGHSFLLMGTLVPRFGNAGPQFCLLMSIDIPFILTHSLVFNECPRRLMPCMTCIGISDSISALAPLLLWSIYSFGKRHANSQLLINRWIHSLQRFVPKTRG